jgi:hypothetical protein
MSAVDDHSPDTEVAAPADTSEPAQGVPTVETQRNHKTWWCAGSALALVIVLAAGYLIGYSTSGSSKAKSQRNHAQALLSRSQQDLSNVKGQLATAQKSLVDANVKGNACSAYAASLNTAVKTAVAMNQALDDFFNSSSGSAAETAAMNRGNQLYDQFEQQRGAANALAPACTGTAA